MSGLQSVGLVNLFRSPVGGHQVTDQGSTFKPISLFHFWHLSSLHISAQAGEAGGAPGLSHRSFLSLPASSLAITNSSRFVSKMAEIIETEFGIRALQAALVERRNKDRSGRVCCNLRLIIVPGGAHKGRGGTRASSQPASHPRWVCGEGWAVEGRCWKVAPKLEVLSVGPQQRQGTAWDGPE